MKSENKKKIPEAYSESYLFETSAKIYLFNKRNYKRPISVGVLSHKMRPVLCISETVTRSNLIREDFLETDWLQTIRAMNGQSLRSTASQNVSSIRTVLSHVRLGEAGIRVVFGTVRNLKAPIFLETSFTDRFVKIKFPPEHKIVLYNSAPVAIITAVIKTYDRKNHGEQEDRIIKNVTVAEEAHNPRASKGVARQATILPKSEGVVLVMTKARGLVQVHMLSYYNLLFAWEVATGTMDVFPTRPFNLLIIKTS